MSKFPAGSAASRVVSLNGLGRERSPGYRLLGECRDQLVSNLSVWLRDIATPIAEELFVLADSTRERLQQTRYLDLRADIEKDWSHLVDTFRRDLAAEAERCQNQDREENQQRTAALEIPDFEGLQLMADDDLSEHIVIREFSAQLAESCDDELYTLNRRVAALLGHDELTESSNPLAPAIVCRALSDACATIGSSAEERLLLLRRIERHLHLGLPPIYRRINAFLIERGILPDLKRTYRRNTSALAQNETNPPGGLNTNGITPTASSAAPSATGEGILEALQRLAQARSNQSSVAFPVLSAPPFGGNSGGLAQSGQAAALTPNSTPGSAIDPELINRLLLASLNEMQHASVGMPAFTGTAGDSIVNQVRLVRNSENAQQLGGLEAVTLDIVAMLFDFIFDDSHIPVAIKALISRLQIPVLKVAMLNPGFFADRQHPTRRFLGSVSGVAVRWGSSVDESDPFYVKLAQLVDRIQAEFENDIEIFGSALAELEAFVDEHDGEEDHTALSAANVVIQREHESNAWERAQRALRSFRNEKNLTPLIDLFLQEHWLDALKVIALDADEQSSAWQAAVKLMDDLAWSVEAKKTPDDRLKLIGLLPVLLGQLNKGLDSIACPSAQRKDFFDALVQCHSAALKGDSAAQTANSAPETQQGTTPAPQTALEMAISPPQDGDLLVTRSIDNGVEVEEVMLVGASPIWRADDREIYRQVSELRRGDWVEFRDEDGHTSRERLNWISPQRGILLFSNHRAAKAISIAPEALARQIRDEKAWIVQQEAIFERALSGALDSIKAN